MEQRQIDNEKNEVQLKKSVVKEGDTQLWEGAMDGEGCVKF